MRIKIVVTCILGISVASALVIGMVRFFTIKPVMETSGIISYLQLPDGFEANIFSDGLGKQSISRPGPNNGARLMTLREGIVYVAVPQDSAIYALLDKDGDGRAEERKTFLGGLRKPHNVDFYEDWAYIAAEDKILRVQDANRDHRADLGTMQTIVALPTGGHWTRTVKITDWRLYIAIG